MRVKTKVVDTILQHEMYPKFQNDFNDAVLAPVEAFEKLVSQWKEKSGLLLELDESIVMPDVVVANICSLKLIGEVKFYKLLQSRVYTQEKPFTISLSYSDVLLFRKAGHQKANTNSEVCCHRTKATAHQSGRDFSRSFAIPTKSHKKRTHVSWDQYSLHYIALPEHILQSHPDTTCRILDANALVQKMKLVI